MYLNVVKDMIVRVREVLKSGSDVDRNYGVIVLGVYVGNVEMWMGLGLGEGYGDCWKDVGQVIWDILKLRP